MIHNFLLEADRAIIADVCDWLRENSNTYSIAALVAGEGDYDAMIFDHMVSQNARRNDREIDYEITLADTTEAMGFALRFNVTS